MNVQPCRHRPDVVGETGGHGRWAAMALGVGQGVVGRTDVVHRADQVHAQGHHALAPGARAGTPHQADQAGAEGGMQALAGGGVHGLTSARRGQPRIQGRFGARHQAAHTAHHATARGLRDHLADDDLVPGRQVRASGALPGRRASHGAAKALTSAASPSTAPSSAPGRAQARTLSARWRMRPVSRWALTTPPNHRRVLTISAIAIPTIPVCTRTRISSACPCRKDQHAPRTRCRCPCAPCTPAAAAHVRTVSAVTPKAATSARTGQPWASRGTTSTILSTGVCFQEHIVPRRARKVFAQPVQRERACCRRCTVMFPFPPGPLAGQASVGQHPWVGSRAFLLGGQEIRICDGPRQCCSTFSPCHGFADTYLYVCLCGKTTFLLARDS